MTLGEGEPVTLGEGGPVTIAVQLLPDKDPRATGSTDPGEKSWKRKVYNLGENTLDERMD